MFKSFLMALSTLTIFPIPYKLYENGDTKQSAHFFPIIGLLLGLVLALISSAIHGLFSSQFNALLILFLSVAVSRAFHLDGFADCADAFWSSRHQEKKLEIMKDSRIGVMGVLALIFLLGAKYIYLERLMHLDISVVFVTVFSMVLAGRCSMNLHMWLIKPKDSGLGKAFWNAKSAFTALIILALGLFCTLPLISALSLLIIILLSSVLWCIYVKKNIGCGTGDTLGASCEISELLVLLASFEFLPLILKLVGNQ